VIFASSEADEKIVREETARSSPSSRSLFLISPLRTSAFSEEVPSGPTPSNEEREPSLVEFDLMTNETGTSKAKSRRQQTNAARRLPILKNKRVKASSLHFFKILPWVVGQNACRPSKFHLLEPMLALNRSAAGAIIASNANNRHEGFRRIDDSRFSGPPFVLPNLPLPAKHKTQTAFLRA
jgi:hypothetical protein